MAGDKLSEGKTPGEALDALTVQLSEEETSTLVIVQNLRPDHFFNVEQQRRLADLMNRWRIAREMAFGLPVPLGAGLAGVGTFPLPVATFAPI